MWARPISHTTFQILHSCTHTKQKDKIQIDDRDVNYMKVRKSNYILGKGPDTSLQIIYYRYVSSGSVGFPLLLRRRYHQTK